MKKIRLLGDIAKDYKADWLLDVQTPSEALRAINANRPGFLAECDEGNYIAVLVNEKNPDNSRQVNVDNGLDVWGSEVLFVVPKINGDGALLVALVAGAAFAATTAGMIIAFVINIAISIAISMIASLISGTPDGFGSNDTEAPENKPSYLFNGVVNTAKQGHRIPIGYGQMLVGSMILSSRINTKDIPA